MTGKTGSSSSAPRLAGAALLATLLACGSPASNPASPSGQGQSSAGAGSAASASPLLADATRGVDNATLSALLADHWEHRVENDPTTATTMGDHRFDDRLPDQSRAAIERDRKVTRELLARARAIAIDQLGSRDATTLALLRESLEAGIALEVCEPEMWNVSPYVSNPIARYNYLPRQHQLATADDVLHLLARYRAISKGIDDIIANLERGAASGLFSNVESVQRTIAMADNQLATPIAGWALLEPLPRIRELAGGRADELGSAFRAVVADEVAPAYRRYRDFLARRILPGARTGDRVGVHALPSGAACYAANIQYFIALPRTAAELHALGEQEIARIDGEMRKLGKKLFGTDDLGKILARLRTDRTLYFSSADEMLKEAQRVLDRASAAVPGAFGIKPRTPCIVSPVPEYEAPFTTIAYYRPPHYDGSKPGEYVVNVYKPETRPRYEFEALTFHESVPGHHLQIAIAQEISDLPAIRKLDSSTAFVEGWALYTEKLADELGLYDGDLARMGMYSYDAWRASRLVVDTGIHAMGWTREQAEAYMREHTALADNNIANEVDRYISWPGQALAYKVGQLEILRLRAWARDQLGAGFSLAGFHDAVLGRGAVTLPVLARQVEEWVAGQKH